MACDACMQRLPFLRAYQIYTISLNDETNVNIDKEDTSMTNPHSAADDKVICRLVSRKKLISGLINRGNSPGYFSEGWRSELCQCENCKV